MFLDEIADITPQTQVALLRVLQEGEFERVGGTETLSVDVRVVCATNKNLEEMVDRGEFRLDLYYRLKGLVLELPPLRERRGDIPRLLQAFADAERPGTPVSFTREAMRMLMSYSWPGNVRELQNFIRSVLLFVEGHTVDKHHIHDFSDFFSHGKFSADVDPLLDEWERGALPPITVSGSWPALVPSDKSPSGPSLVEDSESVQADDLESLEDALVDQVITQGTSLSEFKKRFEIECIRRALIQVEGNVTRAAEVLQMKRPRLSQIVNSTPELSELKDSLT